MRRAEWPGCMCRGRQIAKGTLLSIQKLIKEPLGRICTQQCADHETKLAARQIVLAMDESDYNPPACLIASALLKFMQPAAHMHLDLSSLISRGEKSTGERENITQKQSPMMWLCT
jgi:hypothetical protein